MTNKTQGRSILFAGTTENAASTLRYLVDSGHHVVRVLTRMDAPVGRKAVMTASPVAFAAEELGLPTIKANRLTAADIAEIGSSGASIGVVVAYGTLLSRAALDALESGWLNVHFSLLPKYRGAAPVQHALLNGDAVTGVSIFKLDEGMDTGPVLATEEISIPKDETAGELLTLLTEVGNKLLVSTLEGDLSPESFATQDHQGASYAPKITRDDARISFKEMPSAIVARRVRGLNPEPMAWAITGSQTIRLIRVAECNPTSLDAPLNPGQVQKIESKILVGCSDGNPIELIEVHPAGKKAMPAISWFNGIQANDGIEFE